MKYSTTSLYQFYESPLGYKISKDTYKKVNYDFNTLLVKMLVNTGKKHRLLGGFGELFIRKGKTSVVDKKKVDFNLTKKYGKTIYHENRHSSGFYARFKWDKNKVYMMNKHLYKFVPCRWASRYLSQQIKEENTIVRYDH